MVKKDEKINYYTANDKRCNIWTRSYRSIAMATLPGMMVRNYSLQAFAVKYGEGGVSSRFQVLLSSAPCLALPGYGPTAAPGPSPDVCLWTNRGDGYAQATASIQSSSTSSPWSHHSSWPRLAPTYPYQLWIIPTQQGWWVTLFWHPHPLPVCYFSNFSHNCVKYISYNESLIPK